MALSTRVEFCSSKKKCGGLAVDYLTNFKRLSQPIVLTQQVWGSPPCLALRTTFPHINTWWTFITPGRLEFVTSEHLWQALKAQNLETFLRFAKGGDFGNLSLSFFEKVYAGKKVKGKLISPEHKLNYWSKNGMAGSVAKMAVNPNHAERLGLDLSAMNYARERLDPAVERAVWIAILSLKFAACPVARQQLLGTGDRYLLEWSRSAERETRAGRPPHWSGMVGKDGNVYGENAMGIYLADARNLLQEQL